jgi:hypothetical protein
VPHRVTRPMCLAGFSVTLPPRLCRRWLVVELKLLEKSRPCPLPRSHIPERRAARADSTQLPSSPGPAFMGEKVSSISGILHSFPGNVLPTGLLLQLPRSPAALISFGLIAVDSFSHCLIRWPPPSRARFVLGHLRLRYRSCLLPLDQ